MGSGRLFREVVMDEAITIAAAVVIVLLLLMFVFLVKDKGLPDKDH
jgi:hypothetical protein